MSLQACHSARRCGQSRSTAAHRVDPAARSQAARTGSRFVETGRAHTPRPPATKRAARQRHSGRRRGCEKPGEMCPSPIALAGRTFHGQGAPQAGLIIESLGQHQRCEPAASELHPTARPQDLRKRFAAIVGRLALDRTRRDHSRVGIAMPENFAKNALSALLCAAFIGCIIALATLAWLPEEFMTRTILGGHAEHFIAYLGTAMIMGLTFRKSPRLAVQCILIIVYAAILEAGQLYSPGRHASLQDLAFSSAGVVVGCLILWRARPRVVSWLKLD
jgi:VanZ family protein